MRRGRTPPMPLLAQLPCTARCPPCPGVDSPSLRPQPLALVLPLASPGGLQGGTRDAGSFLYTSSAPRQRPAWLQCPLRGKKEGRRKRPCAPWCPGASVPTAAHDPASVMLRGHLQEAKEGVSRAPAPRPCIFGGDLAACPRLLPRFQKLPVQESLRDTWTRKCELNKMASLTLKHYSIHQQVPTASAQAPLQTCLQRASVSGSEITTRRRL